MTSRRISHAQQEQLEKRSPAQEQPEGSPAPKRPEPSSSRKGSSRLPIYTSDRFVVFEWQVDELARMLGPHSDEFDLHAFFDTLSSWARTAGLVIPRAQVWPWLQQQVEAEARKRGLPIINMRKANKRVAGLIAGGQAFLNRRQR